MDRKVLGPPTPGWKPRNPFGTGFMNPRPPAVPATLELNLSEYYGGCIVIGMLAAQGAQPDMDWIMDQALENGEKMARKAMKRRQR
jgi:hypothetical protein